MITTAPMIADLIAVISNSSFDAFIINNFNQIVYIRDNLATEFNNLGTLFEHQPKENNILFSEIPILKYNKVKKNILNLFCDSIVDFLIKCIDEDYYIRIPINLAYITNTKKTEDFIHTVLFYGYDKINKKFNVADFHDGKRYDFYEYNFSDVKDAYITSLVSVSMRMEYLEDIILFKPNKNCCININIEQIKDGLNDFINSVDSTKKYKYSTRWISSEFYYGLQYFEELSEDLKHSRANLKSFHTIYDYFVNIKYKINKLYENGYIGQIDFSVLSEKVEKCINFAFVSRNKYIKVRYTKSDLSILHDNLIEIRNLSKNLIEYLIRSI